MRNFFWALAIGLYITLIWLVLDIILSLATGLDMYDDYLVVFCATAVGAWIALDMGKK